MQTLFLKLLGMSIAGGAVILIVLLARLLLARSPKKWSYLLWLAVALRLCLPLSIQSPLSVFGLLPQKTEAAQPAVYLPAVIQEEIGSANDVKPRAEDAAPQPAKPASPAAAVTEETAAPRPAKTIKLDALTVCAAIWCAGASAMLLYAAVVAVKLRRRLASATRRENGVYESESVLAPFILGIIRPRIYIPYGVDAETLRHVIAHERSHIAHGDHIIKAFSYLLLALHWFNPLCWLAFYLMSRDMEMSCDERVLADGDARREYSNALLSMAVGKRFPAPSPLGFGENAVRSRILNAMKWKKPKKIVSVISALLCLLVLTACATDPLTPPAGKTEPPVSPTAAPYDVSEPYRDWKVCFIPAKTVTAPTDELLVGYTSGENGVTGPESFVVRGDSIYVLDTVNRRVLVYGKEGLSAIPLNDCEAPTRLAVGFVPTEDSPALNNIRVSFESWSGGYSYSTDGTTVWVSMSGGSPFPHYSLFVLDAAKDCVLFCDVENSESKTVPLPEGVTAKDVYRLCGDDFDTLGFITNDFAAYCYNMDEDRFMPSGSFSFTANGSSGELNVNGSKASVQLGGEKSFCYLGISWTTLYFGTKQAADGTVHYDLLKYMESSPVRYTSEVTSSGEFFEPDDCLCVSNGYLYYMSCSAEGVTITRLSYLPKN